MTNFRLSDRAMAALESIGEYTEDTWGVAQRDKYLDALDERFRQLAQSPRKGRACDNLRPGLRSYRQEAHIIFYLTNPNGIDIVDILHENMDIPARMEDWT